MTVTLIFLHLAGAVTLLLWAVRMVRTGVERAYGAALERALRRARDNRIRAVGLGAAVAMLLQSATAVGILAAGFAASGLAEFGTALTLLLGADLGSALVVQILSFDLSWLIPFLLIAGGWMFLKGTRRDVRQTGRILVGIALILVSLKMIGESTIPLRQSEALPAIVGYLREDIFTSFLLGALFAWFVHSSVAAILLLPLAWISGEQLLPATMEGWAIVVVLAFSAQLLGQSLIAYAFAHLPAAFGALTLLIQPIVAAIAAWILLGEYLGLSDIAGAAVVLSGILIARLSAQPKDAR